MGNELITPNACMIIGCPANNLIITSLRSLGYNFLGDLGRHVASARMFNRWQIFYRLRKKSSEQHLRRSGVFIGSWGGYFRCLIINHVRIYIIIFYLNFAPSVLITFNLINENLVLNMVADVVVWKTFWIATYRIHILLIFSNATSKHKVFNSVGNEKNISWAT